MELYTVGCTVATNLMKGLKAIPLEGLIKLGNGVFKFTFQLAMKQRELVIETKDESFFHSSDQLKNHYVKRYTVSIISNNECIAQENQYSAWKNATGLRHNLWGNWGGYQRPVIRFGGRFHYPRTIDNSYFEKVGTLCKTQNAVICKSNKPISYSK